MSGLIGAAIVLVITAGCVAYQYMKGTLVKAFATLIITIGASIVAFAYFEALAGIFISRGADSRFIAVIPWAQPLCFVLLFVLSFALLQTAVHQLTRQPIDLGFWPECVGRVVCGIVTGLMLSGLLLTALGMAPLPNEYPYARFDGAKPNADSPNRVLLNADGFAAGWFSMISKGSLSGKTSFAAIHPDFLSQLFLNRHRAREGVSVVTSSQAIELPQKAACWPAPKDLKLPSGEPVPPRGDRELMVVRIGIKRRAVNRDPAKDTVLGAGSFALSQLRLICTERIGSQAPLAGKGTNVYPIGYLSAADQLQTAAQIKLTHNDFGGEGVVRWIDFVFPVPTGLVPTLVEFKLNSIVPVPPPVGADQAPPVIPFMQKAPAEPDDTSELGTPADQGNRAPPRDSSRDGGQSRARDLTESIVGPMGEDE